MIEVTAAAAKRIREAMTNDGVADGGLRVGVKAGGCSGFSYVFRWETEPRPDDEVFEAARAHSPLANEIHQSFLAARKNVGGWTKISDQAYLAQRNRVLEV